MGIVIAQSFKNTVTTYTGFVIGAINTLFLYTEFLSDEYYGLVGYVLSTANIMMPLMAFGVHNTLVKFYSTFKTRVSVNSFLTLMLFLPLLIIIPVSLIGYTAYGTIADFLAKENPIIKGYLWHIIITAAALAYFEVFFAWAKVQMQTVFGNFMKEVFHRVGVTVLLFCVFYNFIDVHQFIQGLVGVYVIRMLVMMLYGFSIKLPLITLKRVPGLHDILKYSSLIILAGSIATIFLDIDKFMLGFYIPIEEVAYYNVAIFIATVIAVPQRSMHQILLPLSAELLNNKDYKGLKELYQKSSLNLFIVSGFIFLLIVLNINQLYEIIPEEFSYGIFVVFVISLAKLYDAILGNNNAILFNSDYYRVVLMLGLVLVLITIVLNIVFIPLYGLNGAAFATFLAIFIYNTIKLIFIKKKFSMLPFSNATFKVGGVIILSFVLFYFWDFSFNPILNIIIKSVLIAALYGFIVYYFKFSEDVSKIINRILNRN
ncbi:lipopolysaccharide biosynthesis protein [Changchengzhania lutea]|uniref:lipopolysaccharide biosynthesis protein n=1 Tax=Changchengzhania lutea TaxID=2049305 RepID=UPI00115EAB10|nr:polysaccharide biosynthesis C-terminal domain-containing protein [Changchengzhania lutea]